VPGAYGARHRGRADLQQVSEFGRAQPPGVGDEQRDEDARGIAGKPARISTAANFSMNSGRLPVASLAPACLR